MHARAYHRAPYAQRRLIATTCLLLFFIDSCSPFECDGGGLTIPDLYVEDDYCDCEDGTDERTTGACNNQPFTCPCTPHRPTKVFASRVNDGVCDCCDGSDEFHSKSCPNTCVDAAKAEIEVSQRAAVARATREASGRKAAEERAKKLADARESLASGTALVDAARAAKDAAEVAEASRRQSQEARLAAGEVESALKLSELSADRLGVALARLTLAKEVAGADALHDILSSSDALKEEMADVDSADVIMVAMEAKEAREEAADGTEAGGACAGVPAACGHEAELLALLPLAKAPLDEMRRLVLHFAKQTGQLTKLSEISGALLEGTGATIDGAAVVAALALLEPFHDADADAARAALSHAESTAASASSTVGELEPIEALERTGAFGEAFEWAALHAECYELTERTFKYKLCPFRTFTQDGRSLGVYASWQQQQQQAVVTAAGATESPASGRTMLFDNGEACDTVPRRASVAFECGEHDQLVTVEEPSKCVYTATFRTPSACSTEALRAQHEALDVAAKAAGLPYEPSEALKGLLGI